MASMIVTLIGLRGTGKSTVAPALAARLGCPWADADVVLERNAGRTIREIFATDGEPVFREWERRTIVELLGQSPLVLAAGGGAILNPDTRRDFQAAGPVIWLQASAETLSRRITGDVTTAARRPQLTSAGGLEEIHQLMRIREPFYQECATLAVSTEEHSVAEIVDEILRHIATFPAGVSQ